MDIRRYTNIEVDGYEYSGYGCRHSVDWKFTHIDRSWHKTFDNRYHYIEASEVEKWTTKDGKLLL